ncbi:sensor histidine kinase [Streptosporangium sp. NPDC050855]|uniref:sensor histidine kinase n=1 Tax=Streptosporangium sp. NPDC050855 TaxID=3366194 RepID=UPI00379F97E5
MRLSAPRGGGVLLGLGVAAEVAVVGYWVASANTLVLLGAQALLALLAACLGLVVRFRRISRDLHAQTIEAVAAQERSRIAEDMHDTLGHHLSVMALRAGALQVHAEGRAADTAAALRRDAERAVEQLHEILGVLHPGRLTSREEHDDIEALLHRAIDAGAEIVHTGVLGDDHPAPVRRHLYLILREALTNATRHAPGRVIHVDVGTTPSGSVTVTVRNDLPAEPDLPPGRPDRAPRGIASLERRISAIGGTVEAAAGQGEFVLVASLPHRPRPAAGPPRSFARRSPLLVLLRRTLPPALAALAALMAFYGWSVHDTTMEETDFALVSAGMSEAEVAPLLPPLEAVVRLVPSPPRPAGWRCDHYTDGNFPLGLATFEICYRGGTVVRTTDLRRRSWM